MKKEVIANNLLSYYSSTAQKLIKEVGVVLFAVWESSVHPFPLLRGMPIIVMSVHKILDSSYLSYHALKKN